MTSKTKGKLMVGTALAILYAIFVTSVTFGIAGIGGIVYLLARGIDLWNPLGW